MVVVDLTSSNSSILESGVVLVDFYATWCGPCKRLAPVFERFALGAQDSGVVFVKVDVEKHDDLVTEFDIQAMPTVVLLVKGKPIVRVEGCDESDLGDLVDKAIKSARATMAIYK